MGKFGKNGDYIGKPCEKCGRYRVEHFSKGFDICEKCQWCVQLGRYVSDDEIYDDECCDCKDYETCPCGKIMREDGSSLSGMPEGVCINFKPKGGDQE